MPRLRARWRNLEVRVASLESRPYTISAVCNLVWKFNDEVPNDDYEKLCRLADNIRHGQMTEAFYQRPPGNQWIIHMRAKRDASNR